MNKKDKIITKFGTAKINEDGYYMITTGKEGNHRKLLHRLIFEDFYGQIPEKCHIHHKDGNRTNNCIMNLQILSERQHASLHNKGKSHSEASKQKMSEARNTSGYYRVSKHKNSKCKQGFTWRYRYCDDGKRKQSTITCVSLKKLEQKVKQKGLPWFKIEKEGA